MPKSAVSLLERARTYGAVREYARSNPGLGPSAATRELKRKGYTVPSRETVRHWILDATSPLTGVNVFTPLPSDELSFFLGSWLGDGWGDESDGGKRMRLKVRSQSFAVEFAHAASVLLSKSKDYRVWKTADEHGSWYNVKVTSVQLYKYVTQDLEVLRRVIVPFACGFLRGFATAEGCPSVSISKRRGPRIDVGVTISNSDLDLLCFSRDLLKEQGFRPGKIRLNFPEGHKTNISVATRDAWLLSVSRLDDVQKFADSIGFADSEKQTKLCDAIRFIRESGPIGGAKRWLERYEKVRHKWVRNN